MLGDSYHFVSPTNDAEQAYLESLIAADFARCHPGESLEDIKRRATFSNGDRGLLRDWMALAGIRAAADQTRVSVQEAAE
jgi:hypothetical protein